MNRQKMVSLLVAVWRGVSGRWARRGCILMFLMCISLSAVLRCRTYLLTCRIQAVLAGIAQVRVDQTTEGQLLKAVPFLVRDGREFQRGTSVERHYHVIISNNEDWPGGAGPTMRWVPQFLFRLWPPSERFPDNHELHKLKVLSFPVRVAYLLGWRHLSFAASVVVLDGAVSSSCYRIDPDVFLGWPASDLVVARSVHGLWTPRGAPVWVSNEADESPDFRFDSSGAFSLIPGADSVIGVAYTANAPKELISHVFRVDLTCFWGIRGCDSVRQVVPLLWADEHAIVARAAARVKSQNPCPDRILAGRARTLPDLSVELLEAVNSTSEKTNYGGDRITDYRLMEVIRGRPWATMHYRDRIPWSSDPTADRPDPMASLPPEPGDRFLYFSGARFDSCQIVPATPSAESAVRTAVPAPKRKEDCIEAVGRM
jgi:hypothetical protein